MATATRTAPTTKPAWRYRVSRVLGEGGFSSVSLAYDEALNREVAIKRMCGRHAKADWATSRLFFEAEITAGLEHPGVVPVYDQGYDDEGRAFFAMRYIRGESMSQAAHGFHQMKSPAARRKVLRRLIDRMIDVCYTVGYANDRHVIHRDLTPSNIMLGRHGETLVVDWGLARFQGSSEPDLGPEVVAGHVADDLSPGWPLSRRGLKATRIGERAGTSRYMSPEQALGRWDMSGPATDVFGLGALLYRIVAGRAPFDHEDEKVSLEKAKRGECPRPREVDPRVPAALEAVCLKAMMRDPAARHPSAVALGEDLASWLASEPTSAPPASTLRAWKSQTDPWAVQKSSGPP